MRSSYNSKIEFNTILETITFLQNPKKIVEYGILDGYSLDCFIKSSGKDCKIEAHDIFDNFNGNHADLEFISNKYKDEDKVSISYSDFYNSEQADNSIDILHVDIANNGDVLEYLMENYMSKITRNGIVIFEGGSHERDQVEWMIKYNKKPIRPVIERYRDIYDIHVVEDFPSLTIIKNKQ